MSLIQQIDERLKAAMRAKDENALNVLRMVRTRLKDYARDHKITDDLSDEAVREVVSAYARQLKKSLPEFEKGGESAQAAIDGIKYELDYLEPFLPQLLDEAETRALVAGAVEELGNPPAKMMGKVIGHIMKAHKNEVDATLVRRLVEEALGE
jgi:uncharacterized protein YqeY